MFADDDRGQAIQIGVILLFSFAVIGLSIYQATVVPNQNAKVEFNHNQEVNNDLRTVRSQFIDAADTGDRRSGSVQLGTTYPARIIALNPSPPSGSLRTTNPGELTLSASGGASVADTQTLCGTGSTPVARTLSYQPEYSQYREAPVSGFENGVFFRAFDSATRTDNQSFVDGTEIRLRPLLTSYQASGVDSRTLDLIPTDRVGRDTVTLDNSESLTIQVPSRLDETTWDEVFADRSDVRANDPDTTDGLIDIVVDPSSTTAYTVLCEPMGINEAPAASPPDSRNPTAATTTSDALITAVEPDPNKLSDSSGEFVRIRIPSGENLNAWTIQDGDDRYSFEDPGVDGEVYFARDETAFQNQWSLPDNRVYPLESIALNNAGETVELIDADGNIVDRFAYEGNVFRDGSTQSVGSGEVAYRTPKGGPYTDTDSASDWDVQAECDFFGGGTGCSGGGSSISSASVSDIGSSSAEAQTFTFTLARDYSSGEKVVINLNNAQNPGMGMDYVPANVNDVSTSGGGGGSATVTASGNSATLTYTADAADSAGDQITIELESIDASGPQATSNSPYDVVFEGPDSDTITDAFEVN